MNFIKDSIEEIRKVTWPTRNQAIHLTIITIIFTAVTTLLLTGFDFGFSKVYDILLDISPKVANQSAVAPSGHDATPPDVGGIEATDSEGNPINIDFNAGETTPITINAEPEE